MAFKRAESMFFKAHSARLNAIFALLVALYI